MIEIQGDQIAQSNRRALTSGKKPRGGKLRRMTLFAALLAFLASTMFVGTAAWAGQPPPGYPTASIVATANNTYGLGSIPIRRGFYDGTIDQGFGADKAWNKHNIWSFEAMRRVMLSWNITQQGAQYLLKAYAGKYKCDGWTCTLVDQREIYAVYDTQSYTKYYGWPVGGKMGLLTMYCNQGGIIRCPNWVTYSLLNPGVNNPYLVPTQTADSNMTAAETQIQSKAMSSNEIVSLQASIADGSGDVKFDYKPLPKKFKKVK